MRFVVLGAGLQGSACAYDLLIRSGAESVVIADQDTKKLPPFLEALRGDERLRLVTLDAREEDDVRRVLAGADACMNALPYFFNLEMTRLAIEEGVHYCDLGGNTEIVFQQQELDELARDADVVAIPDCGLAPGMVNILAAQGVREMDAPESVRIRVGGLPQEPEGPLNYQIVYSLQGVLDYYTTPSWIVRGGERRQVEALTEVEELDFPSPVGTLEAFHTAGGLSVMPWTFEGLVPNMEYKTLRYPGHAHIMRAIRELGLLELEPVRVGETSVVPREAFIASVDPRLRMPDSRDLVALRVEVDGTDRGRRRRIVYDLIDYADERTGISAMERATGFSLAITGLMEADGRITDRGVRTPDQCVPADAYLEELRSRGIDVRRSDG
ncbi:MAG: saccharopine dehydrogenase C-terminal domain-containing protein [Longimicrobiales bacterium]